MDEQIAGNIFFVIVAVVVLIVLYFTLWYRREVALFILEALTAIIFFAALAVTSFVMYLIFNILLMMHAGQQYFFFPDEWYVLLIASVAGGLVGCIEKVNLGVGWFIAMAASFIAIVILLLINGFSISPQILPALIWVSFITGSGASSMMRPFTLVYIQTLADNGPSREGGEEK